MKLLAVFFSLFTLSILILDLDLTSDNMNVHSDENENFTMIIPKPLPSNELSVESKWIASKKEDVAVVTEEPVIENNNEILLGNKKYDLLGIFKKSKLEFVSFRNEENEVIKLYIGQALPGKYVLTSINENTIVFVNGDKQVKFKLFERKYNEK
ncbi:hypothetical protein [Thalassotalea sp. SU-HH00458]|uniref:hypothetical protein n=1 Tax=Thalassotalea sp. SU-HH00458 TaxID=3127657 RepID=UPI00310A7E0E